MNLIRTPIEKVPVSILLPFFLFFVGHYSPIVVFHIHREGVTKPCMCVRVRISELIFSWS